MKIKELFEALEPVVNPFEWPTCASSKAEGAVRKIMSSVGVDGTARWDRNSAFQYNIISIMVEKTTSQEMLEKFWTEIARCINHAISKDLSIDLFSTHDAVAHAVPQDANVGAEYIKVIQNAGKMSMDSLHPDGGFDKEKLFTDNLNVYVYDPESIR